jgi:UDP-glucose 4-epimerase
MFEKILHWYGISYGLNAVSLRYFNAAGATTKLGEDHIPETHLIPNILSVALEQLENIPVYGTDYPTRDGSCIRDYIHISDIAQAHILALHGFKNSQGLKTYNLGHGIGYSVLEVIETARKITRKDIPVSIRERRPGDPAVLVASSERAKIELGWQPGHFSLEDIIERAWEWKKNHPEGYRSHDT